MMWPTHAVVGLAIATPFALLMPDLAPTALAAALVGSLVPDADLYVGHRRTLHFPTVYTLLAVPAAVAAAILWTPATIAVAFGLVGAAVHCRMDRYGCGLELRPWEGTDDRAVYDHIRGRWRPPKRWIRYDGAPEDFLLTALLGVPLWIVLEEPFHWVVAGALVLGAVYAALRRRLVPIGRVVFEFVPKPLSPYVPERYRP